MIPELQWKDDHDAAMLPALPVLCDVAHRLDAHVTRSASPPSDHNWTCAPTAFAACVRSERHARDRVIACVHDVRPGGVRDDLRQAWLGSRRMSAQEAGSRAAQPRREPDAGYQQHDHGIIMMPQLSSHIISGLAKASGRRRLSSTAPS